jgi:sec-independent protein translocase protein TatA
MLGNIGMTELIVILVIVLVLFGAKRIPEISASFGKGIREFKKNVNDVERQITEPETTRYDSRLATGETARTETAKAEEVRPEPKRLI